MAAPTVPVPDGFRLRAHPDAGWRGDTTLEAPGVIVEVSPAHRAVASALLDGVGIGDAGPHAGFIARRLLDADLADPLPPAANDPSHTVVVVPAFNAERVLPRLLASLGADHQIVVVDDGSTDKTACVAPNQTIPGPANHGPSAARNHGLARTTAPILVFVDADVVVEHGTVERLVAHLADPAVAMAAPRVRALNESGTRLERYEAVRSPLDLGAHSGRVVPGGPIAFVPSTALAVRRAALTDVGGFDESMHFGEDMDLCWRLHRAGWTVRYDADATIRHDHRVEPVAFLKRRAAYASPAAALAARHSVAATAAWVAPPGMVAAAAVALVAGPVSGAAVAAGSIAAEGAGPSAHDHIRAARAGLFALTRPWLPAALAAGVVNRKARAMLAAALVTRHLLDWRRTKPDLDPLTWLALRTADDLASAAGLWAAVVKSRNVAPLGIRFRGGVRREAIE